MYRNVDGTVKYIYYCCFWRPLHYCYLGNPFTLLLRLLPLHYCYFCSPIHNCFSVVRYTTVTSVVRYTTVTSVVSYTTVTSVARYTTVTSVVRYTTVTAAVRYITLTSVVISVQTAVAIDKSIIFWSFNISVSQYAEIYWFNDIKSFSLLTAEPLHAAEHYDPVVLLRLAESSCFMWCFDCTDSKSGGDCVAWVAQRQRRPRLYSSWANTVPGGDAMTNT